MELLEYKTKLFELLGIQEMDQLPNALEKADDDLKKKYIEQFGLERDWIRELYQYYLADREGLKQDYTPESLASLLGAIVGKCGDIVDLCAGSGSLSLHVWPQSRIKAYEMDSNVLPFLKLNLSIHGRTAEIIQADVLNENLTAEADGVISNPPFNISNSAGYGGCRTGNWAFVMKALSMARKRAALILPVCVLREEKDKETVRKVVSGGNVEAVILCPGKMFASTSIPVCVLVLNRENHDRIVFVDASKIAEKQTREQCGQYSGSSHTGRVYKKEFSVFSDECIAQIVNVINKGEDSNFSKSVLIKEVMDNDYNLSPKCYVPNVETEEQQTKLEWIAEQYNAIIRQKNACKLVISETLAKQLGLDKELWEQAKKNSAEVAEMISKVAGAKLETEDYLTFTKSRELTIRFKSKDVLPEIFQQFVPMWVNRITLLNNLENGMLGQMRDYLLPRLMSGELKLDE